MYDQPSGTHEPNYWRSPIFIVQLSILNHSHPLWCLECKTNGPIALYLCLEPILLFQMIWSTSYHYATFLVHWSWPQLLFTVELAIGVKSCSRFTIPWSIASKPRLALHTSNRSIEPSLILIFSILVTWLHAMSHIQWDPHMARTTLSKSST
jgi:hypothetical protein